MLNLRSPYSWHLLLLLPSAIAILLIDFAAPGDMSDIGSCQLEGSSLGDHIDCPGNDAIYIKPGQDPQGKAALHYHREPSFRRAEMKGKGDYAAGKKYYVGYEFQLSHVHEHLALFQWYRKPHLEPILPIRSIFLAM